MIKVKDLYKVIDGEVVLDHLNMQVEEGSIYGLIGPNGAGKTTLIRHLVGVLKQDTGKIFIESQPVYENIEIKRSWKLNERHYGALQGLNKDETKEKYGEKQVLLWRRSTDVRPPELEETDERYPLGDENHFALMRAYDRALSDEDGSTFVERDDVDWLDDFELTKDDLADGK